MIESDEDEEEKDKEQPEIPVTEPEKSTVETKPSTIGLPMTEASDAWMDQEETIGMIESDEDEEEKDKEQPEIPVTEPEKSTVETKPSTIGLPMTEASDAWMDQEETIGMIESDEDEEQEEEEKEQPETPVTEPEKSTVDIKLSNIGLPMTEASDAWMDQDETIEMIESDEDEEQEEKEKEQPETPVTEPEKSTVDTKLSTIALPMTEASDAWMDQGETIEMIESDEDEEEKEEEKEKDQSETPVTEPEKSTVEAKPSTIALPMTEASDAWMDQDETIEMIESDEDE